MPLSLDDILDAKELEDQSEAQILEQLRARGCAIPNEVRAIRAALRKLKDRGFSRDFRENLETIIKTGKDEWVPIPPDIIERAKKEEAVNPPEYADKIWAIILGISDYQDVAIPDLMFAAKDAGAFAQYLLSLGVPQKQIYLLQDKQATLSKMSKGLQELQRKVGKDGIIMVFFSGHGGADRTGDVYFLLQDTDSGNPAKTAYPMREFKKMLRSMPTNQVLAFLDACHSGSATQGKFFIAKDVNLGAMQKTSQDKIASLVKKEPDAEEPGQEDKQIGIFTSSQEDQISQEDTQEKHGLFTYYLLEGLKQGKADENQDGKITLEESYLYVYEKVGKRTKGKQIPRKYLNPESWDQKFSVPPLTPPSSPEITIPELGLEIVGPGELSIGAKDTYTIKILNKSTVTTPELKVVIGYGPAAADAKTTVIASRPTEETLTLKSGEDGKITYDLSAGSKPAKQAIVVQVLLSATGQEVAKVVKNVVIVSKPDIQAKDISAEISGPNEVVAGQTPSYSIKIRNTSDTAVAELLVVMGLTQDISSTSLANSVETKLSLKTKRHTVLTYKLPPNISAGKQILVTKVSDQKTGKEFVKANKTIVVQGIPDIKATDLTLSLQGPSEVPAEDTGEYTITLQNRNTKISADLIVSISTTIYDNRTLDVLIAGSNLVEKKVVLTPNQQTKFSYQLPRTKYGTVNKVFAKVILQKTGQELLQKSATVTIVKPEVTGKDVLVQIEGPTSIAYNSTASYTILIRNKGQSSEDFTVEVRIPEVASYKDQYNIVIAGSLPLDAGHEAAYPYDLLGRKAGIGKLEATVKLRRTGAILQSKALEIEVTQAPSSLVKTRRDFGSDDEYGKYVQSVLQPNMRVIAIANHGDRVKAGATGTYFGTNGGSPPCLVIWDTDIGTKEEDITWMDNFPAAKKSYAYWVHYYELEILGSSQFKTRANFLTDEQYSKYMEANLKSMMRVRAIKDYEKVKKGMSGTYYGTTPGNPPCFVIWDPDLGTDVTWFEGAPRDQKSHAYWVYWKDIEIIGAGTGSIPESKPSVVSSSATNSAGFKTRNAFASNEDYGAYIKSVLQINMRVKALAEHGKVTQGMTGTYYGTNDGTPPCFVVWDTDLGSDVVWLDQAPSHLKSHAYWVEWHEVEIIDGSTTPKHAISPSLSFKKRSDFASDDAYITYMKANLKSMMRVRAIRDYEKVKKDMLGTYYGTTPGNPPCFVIWDPDLGTDVTWFEGAPRDQKSHAYWVYWKDIEIIGQGSSDYGTSVDTTDYGVNSAGFKTRSSFPSDDAYSKYVEANLRPMMRVRAIQDYEKVKQGMLGTYYGTTPGNPPCFVIWDPDLGTDVTWFEGAPRDQKSHAYWVYWKGLEIIGQGSSSSYTPSSSSVNAAGFKTRSSFSSDAAYGDYIKSVIQMNMRVQALADHGKVTKGMSGVYYGTNDASPPCFVIWDDDLGSDVVWLDQAPSQLKSHAYWVEWYEVEIIDGSTTPKHASSSSSSFKTRSDFASDDAYITYMKANLQSMMRVRAIRDYEKVKQGMSGTYYGTTPGNPPCFVIWDPDLGTDVTWFEGAPSDKKSHAYWVYWKDIEIIGNSTTTSDMGSMSGGIGSYSASSFKSRYDFSSDEDYGNYIQSVIQVKMRVRAINDYEKVAKGSTGTYYGTNGGSPPCFVIWDDDLGTDVVWIDGAPEDKKSHAYWVYWKDVEIID